MNLNELTKKITDTKVIIGVGVAVAILLLALSYFLPSKPSLYKAEYPLAEVDIKDQITPNLALSGIRQGQAFSSVNMEFNVTQTELPIYKYKKFDLDENLTDEIIGLLGMKDVVKRDSPYGQVISAQSSSASIAIYPDQNELVYSAKIDVDPDARFPLTFVPNVNAPIVKAFVESFGVDMSLYSPAGINYLLAVTNQPVRVETQAEGNIVEYSYKASINDIPLVDSKGTLRADQITVWMTTTDQILKATVKYTGKLEPNPELVPLIDFETAVSAINAGETSLISVDGIVTDDIASTTVNSINLVYYVVDGYAIPVYQLEGISTTSKFKKVDSHLILEAVDTERVQ